MKDAKKKWRGKEYAMDTNVPEITVRFLDRGAFTSAWAAMKRRRVVFIHELRDWMRGYYGGVA